MQSLDQICLREQPPTQENAGLSGSVLPQAAERLVDPREIPFLACESRLDISVFLRLRRDLLVPQRLMLTDFGIEDYERMSTRLFIAANNGGGYGINPDGELISLFSLPGFHLGRRLIEDAVLQGARRAECFDMQGRLPRLYEQFGFREVERTPWNDAKAPALWDTARLGRPDVIIMELRPQ